ncbi:pupal cuticle protein Edg-78E-like [Calliphora vicina]|uniref:pupal cuticle protein Edg-78E-like n=1 Tax=Calliphora vicina TaxID=7373 RepID=UPI00325BF961
MYKFLIVTIFATLACGILAASNEDKYAQITKYVNNIDEYGNYNYDYATSNGISAGEQGTGGQVANGGYSYYSPEGEFVQVSYVANEDGFQPSGSHLPTPPPIPHYILKSLEYIRTHPSKYQDA